MPKTLHICRRDFIGCALAAACAHPLLARDAYGDGFAQLFADTSMPADQKLDAVVKLVTAKLQTDRTFIYMRDPIRRMTAYTHLFNTRPDWGQFALKTWSPEPNPKALNEPMLKSAFDSDKVHFVDDIETAPQGSINRTLERTYFGHRALIHAPLYHDGTFFGILETAMKDTPRVWSQSAQTLIRWLQPRVAQTCHHYLTNPT